jgi:hypothetical protein
VLRAKPTFVATTADHAEVNPCHITIPDLTLAFGTARPVWT